MSFLVVFLMISFGLQVSAQEAFPVKIRDFSDKYEAIVDVNVLDSIAGFEGEKYLPEYVIKIIEKKSQKEILKTFSDYFPDYLLDENNEAIPNIKELPYGSQSVLLYEDYNFDGVKDLALMNGNYSCYGGPSFDIYLAQNNTFEYNESFSVLSNEYCGMFQIDQETKTISTMVKSGCCWHQFSVFKVINNEPKIIKTTERSYLIYNNFIEITETTYDNDKEKSTTNLYFPFEEMMSQIVLHFELEKNEKSVVLYEINEKLYYVFLQKDDKVEIYFPPSEENENEWDFSYHPDNGTMTFSNENAEYQIYETEENIGIKVTTNGKTYDMKGVKSTANGSLKNQQFRKLTNLIYEVF